MAIIKYPKTRKEKVIETRAGVEFPDPYKWLEEDTDEVRQWQRAQGMLAADYVREWPHFDTVKEFVARFSVDNLETVARFAGGKWFRTEIPDGSSQARVLVSETPYGEGEVLFDPRNENPDTPPFVSWLTPSPDGSVIAVGVCTDGSENNTIRLVKVDTGELLPNSPPQTLMDSWTGGAVWLPDSSGFYFLGLVGDPAALNQEVLFHNLEKGSQNIPEIPFPNPESADYSLVTVSNDGRHLVAHHGIMTPSPVAIKNLNIPDAIWQPFITEIHQTVAGNVVGDRFVAVTDVNAPRGRVVAIPLNTKTPNDPSTWIELVPESEAIIRAVTSVKGILYLSEFVDTYTRVRMVDSNGSDIGEVPLPENGAISEMPFPLMNLPFKGHPDEFIFTFSSLRRSWGIYSHVPGQDDIKILKAPEVVLENAIVEDHWATSPDGTKIPYHTVRLADVDYSKPCPALIYAYGGFNAPCIPQFPGPMAAFVAAGGVFVHGHLRGGGEFGLEWWEGGRMKNKQNCYADLYAIAQEMIGAGMTNPDLLAVTGASNGGLLCGVAATQRPDLWKAVVPRVPLMDLIGCMRDVYGLTTTMLEFGNPEDPDEIRRIAGFSPYHLVKDGTKYPAVYIDAGDTDPRCPPWHSRKFGALMQAANAGDTPILIRIWENVGHGWATDKEIQIAENTEWLAFVMRHLNMEL